MLSWQHGAGKKYHAYESTYHIQGPVRAVKYGFMDTRHGYAHAHDTHAHHVPAQARTALPTPPVPRDA